MRKLLWIAIILSIAFTSKLEYGPTNQHMKKLESAVQEDSEIWME
ncbi:MAG TPA: hypothetical protein VK168_14105 [Saprospiraceae bacterium]|nr:hypothetical protein [Saprospiraceae bacterium]